MTLTANGKDLFSSGYIHGKERGDLALAYIHDVAVPHALRTLEEWVFQVYQALIHHISMFVDTTLVHYQISKWAQGGTCPLE